MDFGNDEAMWDRRPKCLYQHCEGSVKDGLPEVTLLDRCVLLRFPLLLMKPRNEIALAIMITGFVWISLFAHWLPALLQSILFALVLLLALVLLVLAWWRFRSALKDEGAARWRKVCGLVALIASTLTFATPVFAFLYAVAMFQLRIQPSHWIINWLVVIPVCLVLALCALVGGVLAPTRIRLATALSGLIGGCIVVAIPIGIL